MKKTMFKKVFAGIAAVFTLGLCVPTGFTNIITQHSFEAVAEDEWLDMCGIEYKIKDRDTLIINDNSDASIELYDFYFETYAADIKHLQIGNGWKIHSFIDLTAIESLTIGDDCDIGRNAFYWCELITSVKIGGGCDIEYEAFEDCTALESVIIGNDCTIGEMAFWNCTALTDATIGEGCTIEYEAFDGCTALESVIIGNDCTIGKMAFCGCDSIEKVLFSGKSIESVKVDASNPDIISDTSRWTVCGHDFDANHKCKVCGYKCKHAEFDEKFNCTICGYFNESAAQAEIDANEAEIEQKENEIKQKENEITQKQERNAYLSSLLKEQEKHSETEPPTTTEDGNTASTFSDGSVLVIVGGSTFLILCGLAAVIIVKRRKKTQ